MYLYLNVEHLSLSMQVKNISNYLLNQKLTVVGIPQLLGVSCQNVSSRMFKHKLSLNHNI